MVVLPLLLGGDENVTLCAPLLLGEGNKGGGLRVKHRTVSLVFLLVAGSLRSLPTQNRWPDLACELTEQAEDDRSWVVDVDWTCTNINKAKAKLKAFS